MTKAAPPRPWIAYVVPFAFPDGGAGARRVLGNAQSLVKAGYDVTIISAQIDPDGGEARPFAPGMMLASTSERNAEHLPRALKRASYIFMGRETGSYIANAPLPPAAVILYSGYTPYLLNLRSLCRRRGIPLIFDAVEWYTAPSLGAFLLSPYLWNTEFAMRRLIPKVDGVIAISSWLAEYYGRRGRPVAQVPPTLDTAAVAPSIRSREAGAPLRIAYCGSASNDLLGPVIAALRRLDPALSRITLEVAGPSAEEVTALPELKDLARLPTGLRLHGRVGHDRVLQITRDADFTIFLRRINRVSTAGFPTKFGESLALGTPVITNLTSDLAEMLRDGENGLVCAGPTIDALVEALQRAEALTPEAHGAMRLAARATAETHFDSAIYAGRLAGLLAQCKVEAPAGPNFENHHA